MGIKYYKFQFVCDECNDNATIITGYGEIDNDIWKELESRLKDVGWDAGAENRKGISRFGCMCKVCNKIINNT